MYSLRVTKNRTCVDRTPTITLVTTRTAGRKVFIATELKQTLSQALPFRNSSTSTLVSRRRAVIAKLLKFLDIFPRNSIHLARTCLTVGMKKSPALFRDWLSTIDLILQWMNFDPRLFYKHSAMPPQMPTNETYRGQTLSETPSFAVQPAQNEAQQLWRAHQPSSTDFRSGKTHLDHEGP